MCSAAGAPQQSQGPVVRGGQGKRGALPFASFLLSLFLSLPFLRGFLVPGTGDIDTKRPLGHGQVGQRTPQCRVLRQCDSARSDRDRLRILRQHSQSNCWALPAVPGTLGTSKGQKDALGQATILCKLPTTCPPCCHWRRPTSPGRGRPEEANSPACKGARTRTDLMTSTRGSAV